MSKEPNNIQSRVQTLIFVEQPLFISTHFACSLFHKYICHPLDIFYTFLL